MIYNKTSPVLGVCCGTSTVVRSCGESKFVDRYRLVDTYEAFRNLVSPFFSAKKWMITFSISKRTYQVELHVPYNTAYMINIFTSRHSYFRFSVIMVLWQVRDPRGCTTFWKIGI